MRVLLTNSFFVSNKFYFRNNARKDFSGDTLCSQSHGGRTSNFCLIFSTPRLAKRMAALNLATVTSTPAATPPRPKANAFTADWTLGCRAETASQSSGDDEAAESTSELAILGFTDAMEKLNPVATGAGCVSPLTFQLKSTWEEAKEHEKKICIDKATEACTLICDIIVPKAEQELFRPVLHQIKGPAT